MDLAGRKLQANAEDSGDADELENPPKVEEKLRAVPSGVSTDSDVTKRCRFGLFTGFPTCQIDLDCLVFLGSVEIYLRSFLLNLQRVRVDCKGKSA